MGFRIPFVVKQKLRRLQFKGGIITTKPLTSQQHCTFKVFILRLTRDQPASDRVSKY